MGWLLGQLVRIHPHPFFPCYQTVNFYACSSPTPALAKTWTLSMETSTGGTQISRFVKFKDANLSLFASASALFFVRFSRRSTSKGTRHTPELKLRISDSFGSFGYAAVPSHPANFVSSNQPNYQPYPSLTHSCTPPSSPVTLLVTPPPISTRLANVDDWIDIGYCVCASAMAFEQ